MNLADYRKGSKGTVLGIKGDPDFKKRMMEMGFVRGTKVLSSNMLRLQTRLSC